MATPRSAAAYSIFSANPAGNRVLIGLVAAPGGRPRFLTAVFSIAVTQ